MMRGLLLTLAVLAQVAPASGPETFKVTGTVPGEGAVVGNITIAMTLRLDEFSPERTQVAIMDALKYRGYPGFLVTLRESPPVGSLTVGSQKFTVRWARQVAAGPGRTITIVTDTPVFFVGARKADAKSTKGYEVAVMRLDLDATGGGTGTMAAAARVKPDGAGGVTIDQYAETPLTLTVTR
jgi:hypothetical protein